MMKKIIEQIKERFRARNRIVMKEVTKTCSLNPSQWDGVSEDGEDVYIRYKNSKIVVIVGDKTIFSYNLKREGNDGYMDTSEMVEITGKVLKWSYCKFQEGITGVGIETLLDSMKRNLKDALVKWIQRWFEQHKSEKAIIGLNELVGSIVSVSLFVEALGADRVICIVDKLTPIKQKVIEKYKVKYYTLPMRTTSSNIMKIIESNDETVSKDLMARLKISTLYALAQSVNGSVVNTTTATDRFVGNFVLWGSDSVGDISPFGGIIVSDVSYLGKILGIPGELLLKKSENDNEDYDYSDIDNFIRGNTSLMIDSKIKNIINDHNRNLNKIKSIKIPTFNDYFILEMYNKIEKK